MEYNYPKFTPEMKKTHTILIPNMAITQFRLLEYALRYDGYKCEILGNCGSAVAQLGLKYVHNDTCYPALLVIGQFLDALNSGKYDLEHTALLNMVYGPDGETPVEDDELTSHLDDSMYEICYISIPLYNTSTYAFADDDQKAEMLKLAQAAADSVNTPKSVLLLTSKMCLSGE